MNIPKIFIFAKVDVDEQPALREKYKIENIPTLLVFKDGQIIKSDLMREEAREKHLSGDISTVILLLTEAI